MADRPRTTIRRCPVCHGRGALRCDCWPGDCICGWDDEPCETCDGTGWIDPEHEDSLGWNELPSEGGVHE